MRVAVLGAGYAGLVAARALEDALPPDVELVVVDESPYHLVQHLLHRVVRRPGFADEITVPLTDLLDRAEIVEATVTGVATDARTVTFADRDPLDYDVAAVCLGAETEFYDLPGVEEHATPLKRVRHARTIRDDFLDLLDRPGESTVVVGGAGLSGIQVAGELAAFADEEDAADRVGIRLVEGLDSVAPGFTEPFQAAVRDELDALGVAVRTGATVERATDDRLQFADGEDAEYDQFVWTGGIRGPAAMGGERPTVRSTLALDDRTFVVGDAGRVVDDEGRAVPASAQAAVAEARTAARNVASVVASQQEGTVVTPRLERFVFDARGWLVSVGDEAVAQVGPSVFTGRAAEALKTGVGAGYLASAGAVRDAVDLVRSEFRAGSRDEAE